MLLPEGQQDDLVSLGADRTVYKQISRDALKERRWINEASSLIASRGTKKNFLQQVGRIVGTGVPPQITQQGAAIVSKCTIQRCDVSIRGAHARRCPPAVLETVRVIRFCAGAMLDGTGLV